MASTKVQSRSMIGNIRSFSREIGHALKSLVSSDDFVDSKAAAEFSGTVEKIAEKEAYRDRLRRKNGSSGRSTLTRIEPESPYQNMGAAEKQEDLDIGDR